MEGYFSWGEKKAEKVFRELFILKSNYTFIFLDFTWRLMASSLLAYQKVKPARVLTKIDSRPKSPKKAYYKLQKKQE